MWGQKARRILAVVAVLAVAVAQIVRTGLTGTVTDSSGRTLLQTHIMAVQNGAGL
jgi:hypothetical protein